MEARMFGRGKGSGVEVDQLLFHVWTIREKRAAAVRTVFTKKEALEATACRSKMFTPTPETAGYCAGNRFGGRGKTSGLEVAPMGTKGASLFHIRAGKVTRLAAYFDRERAFADLGLEE